MDVYYGSIHMTPQTAIVGGVGFLIFMTVLCCLAACCLKLYCWGKNKMMRQLMHSQEEELEEVVTVPMLN